MATADSFIVLLLSFMLFTMTATISGAPYTVTNTAVPLEQRGLFNALWVRTAALLSRPRRPSRAAILRDHAPDSAGLRVRSPTSPSCSA